MNSHAKRNWSGYNKNLVNRGSLTIWIDSSVVKNWIVTSGKPGRPKFSNPGYSIEIYLEDGIGIST